MCNWLNLQKKDLLHIASDYCPGQTALQLKSPEYGFKTHKKPIKPTETDD